MTEKLNSLINIFLQKVAEAEEIMKIEMDIEEPRLYNKNGYPRTGKILNHSYSFHGIGCRFELDDITIDYDYGNEGRTDGFDEWRLEILGEQLDEFKLYVTNGELKYDFKKSVKSGELIKSGNEYDNLYYLSKNI